MPCNTEVPSALRSLDQWIRWGYDERGRKIPYQVNGRKAKSNDPSTWSSFAVAHAAGEQLGFCFAENGGLFGLDLDGCRDPATGQIAEWAQAVINELASYSEVSPSGTGVKVYGPWARSLARPARRWLWTSLRSATRPLASKFTTTGDISRSRASDWKARRRS